MKKIVISLLLLGSLQIAAQDQMLMDQNSMSKKNHVMKKHHRHANIHMRCECNHEHLRIPNKYRPLCDGCNKPKHQWQMSMEEIKEAKTRMDQDKTKRREENKKNKQQMSAEQPVMQNEQNQDMNTEDQNVQEIVGDVYMTSEERSMNESDGYQDGIADAVVNGYGPSEDGDSASEGDDMMQGNANATTSVI